MKKLAVFISIISIVCGFASCKKTSYCNVSEPLTELSWLASMKETDNVRISKAIFKEKETKMKQEGFIIEPNETYPLISNYFNCSGEILCSVGGVVGSACEEYEVIKKEVIYETPIRFCFVAHR